jgi:hypothetical protein
MWLCREGNETRVLDWANAEYWMGAICVPTYSAEGKFLGSSDYVPLFAILDSWLDYEANAHEYFGS